MPTTTLSFPSQWYAFAVVTFTPQTPKWRKVAGKQLCDCYCGVVFSLPMDIHLSWHSLT